MIGQAAPRLAAHTRAATFSLPEMSLRQVAALLVVAATAETLLLRLATRVGVHLPKDEAVGDAVHLASLLGTLALNFASVLAIALVALLLAALLLRTATALGRLAVAVLAGGLLWGLGSTLTTDAVWGDALFGLSVTIAVAGTGLVLAGRTARSLRARLAIALMVVAYLCYQYYSLAHLSYRMFDLSSLPPVTVPALRLGEGLVVAAGGVAFWAWGAHRWGRAGFVGTACAGGAVLIIAAGSAAPAATTSILSLWTTGLSLFLPLPLYLLSLGLFLLTAIACLRSGEEFWTGAGLVLVLLAGYMPEATYHHLLLLLGVAFLSGVMSWATEGGAGQAVGAPSGTS